MPDQQLQAPIQRQNVEGARLPSRRESYSDTEPFTQPLNQQSSATSSRNWPIPPEPLTEFQKFIASTTGEVLPVFGSSLFRSVPASFEPHNPAPVPADYVIGPEDELRIRVWGQFTYSANVRVGRSGDIFIPQVGSVHVAGLQVSELEAHLRSSFERLYHNFEISVELGQIRTIQVYVAGEARRPGLYTVSSLSSLVDALFASGGPSTHGSLRSIQLRRRGKLVVQFDLYDLLLHGDTSRDSHLQSGDVIFIPAMGAEAAITGSVRIPAIFELKDGESLGDLIAAAGGASATAAEARVFVERIEDHKDRRILELGFDQASLATPAADGDLVHIDSITPGYRKTVILRGNTANPGRYTWHPGMRLSELIPNKEALLTRDYWWKRTQLGLSSPEFEPDANLSAMVQPSGDRHVPIDLPAMQSDSFPDPDAPLAEQAHSDNAALAATLRSANTPHAAQQKKIRVGLLSPEINWDYAVIDRQNPTTLKMDLVPFDLGRLVLQHDASQDQELQPGDVVTVFSQDDVQVPLSRQTRLVKLEGEFVHAGVYLAEPGETLRQLVKRAGGITPNAYLYGSMFTRESTRKIQQARLNEYVQTLEMQMGRANAAITGASVTHGQQPGAGSAVDNSQREMLNQLRQLRASGRIVLRIEPDSKDISELPDLRLENGDTFVVPPLPENVNVLGAVANQNSFIYSRGLRTGAYLRMAGGPNAEANRKREFIIRADGEVLSRESTHGVWGNNFDQVRLNPGDTIVVPEKVFRPSAMQSVIEWSQMVSQFALGAAALSVVR